MPKLASLVHVPALATSLLFAGCVSQASEGAGPVKDEVSDSNDDPSTGSRVGLDAAASAEDASVQDDEMVANEVPALAEPEPEPTPEPAEPEPVEPEPEPVEPEPESVEPEPEPVEPEPEPVEPEPIEPTGEPEPQPQPTTEPQPQPTTEPEPQPTTEPEAIAEPEPSDTSLDSCDVTLALNRSSYCQRELTCENGSPSAYCHLAPPALVETWGCSCTDPNGAEQYQLEGVDRTSACSFGVDVCNHGDGLEYGEQTCQVSAYPLTGSTCVMKRECRQSAQLRPEVEVVRSESQSVSCAATGEQSDCTCYPDERELEFVLPAPEIELSTCEDAMDICDQVATATPAGPSECEHGSSNATSLSTTCEILTVCTRSTEVSGINISVRNRVTSRCSLLTGTTWSCLCLNAATGSESYEQEATTASSACDAAAVACPIILGIE
jgi:hypothetical protein